MNTSLRLNSEGYMACHHTRSENGSKILGCATQANQPPKPSEMDSSLKGQADNPERTFTFGTQSEPQNCLTECSIQGPLMIQTNNSLGQQILDADGNTIAWTTDPWVAQVIVKLLTENDGLLV